MPIYDVPGLKSQGALSAGETPAAAFTFPPMNASGNIPNRPASTPANPIPPGPATFIVPIPGPLGAAVALGAPSPPPSADAGTYEIGDVLKLIRTDHASAFSVTVLDGYTGPAIAGAVLAEPANSANLSIQLNAAGHWVLIGGGAL